MSVTSLRTKLATGVLAATLVTAGPGFVSAASADGICKKRCAKQLSSQLDDASKRIRKVQKQFDLDFLDRIQRLLRRLENRLT